MRTLLQGNRNSNSWYRKNVTFLRKVKRVHLSKKSAEVMSSCYSFLGTRILKKEEEKSLSHHRILSPHYWVLDLFSFTL